MLEIKPVFERPAVAAYCRKCGKVLSEAFYLYLAMDGDEVLAGGLFEVQSDRVVAAFYEAEAGNEEDHFLFDGILRAGLNYASGQGVEIGYIPEEFRQDNKALFARLNYPAERELNIVSFFNKYKNCTV